LAEVSMNSLTKIKISATTFFCAACIAGCATQSFEAANAPGFLIQSDYTPFYSLGPGQERGPDASLQRGERVKMLRREFGFSYVEINDGRAGYIANEEIAPAPPDKPEPAASASRKKSTGGSAMGAKPSDALFTMPEIEALPEPVDVLHPISEMEPAPDSKPEFRY